MKYLITFLAFIFFNTFFCFHGNCADPITSRLVDMAIKKHKNLTEDEILFLIGVEKGMISNFSSTYDINKKTLVPIKAKKKIRSDMIFWLCNKSEPLKYISQKGIRLNGATISGDLNLSSLTIEFPLEFKKCVIEGKIYLDNSKIKRLVLSGSKVKSIQAQGLRVDDGIFLNDGFVSTGELNFLNSVINGPFICSDSRFLSKGSAFTGDNIEVNGPMLFRNGFRSEGEVRLIGAKILKDLDCSNGIFNNIEGNSINADSITVNGSVFFRNGFRSEGEISLVGGTIMGDLDLSDSQLTNDGNTLNAERVRINDTLILQQGTKSYGTLNIKRASIGYLYCGTGVEIIQKNSTAINATEIKINNSLIFEADFKVIGEARFNDSTIGHNFNCADGVFSNKSGTALNIQCSRIRGNLFLWEGLKIEGLTLLAGSKIDGEFDCNGGHFIGGVSNYAINADRITVRGNVSFNKNFQAEGLVSLNGSVINGDLNCTGGSFNNIKQTALQMQQIKVKRSAFFNNGFRSNGEVDLLGAKISGDLICDKGNFFNSSGRALNAVGSTIKGSARFMNGFNAKGAIHFQKAEISGYFYWSNINYPTKILLNLKFANIGILKDEYASWPKKGNLYLDGLEYDSIEPFYHFDVKERLNWLRLQPYFSDQPYKQLANFCYKIGRDDFAKEILFEKNIEEFKLKDQTYLYKIWNGILKYTIGYGYYPLRAIKWSCFCILIGYFVFWGCFRKDIIQPTSFDKAYMPDYNKGKRFSNNYPIFHPLIFSFETFIPLIELGQKKYWWINEKKRKPFGQISFYYSICHKLVGWLLTTFFLMGLGGLIKT